MRRGLLAIGVGFGLALAYVGLSMCPTQVEGRNDALAWCIGLAPIAFLYGVADLIYQRFAPATTSGDERHP